MLVAILEQESLSEKFIFLPCKCSYQVKVLKGHQVCIGGCKGDVSQREAGCAGHIACLGVTEEVVGPLGDLLEPIHLLVKVVDLAGRELGFLGKLRVLQDKVLKN